MRILLDESLPKRLMTLLSDHDSATVAQQGWASYSNGKLLQVASEEFDILLTADQNLPSQQNLDKFAIAIVIVAAKSNQLQDYLPLKGKLLEAIAQSSTQKLQWVTA